MVRDKECMWKVYGRNLYGDFWRAVKSKKLVSPTVKGCSWMCYRGLDQRREGTFWGHRVVNNTVSELEGNIHTISMG